MKKGIAFVSFLIILIISILLPNLIKKETCYRDNDGLKYNAKTDNNSFYIYRSGKWEKTFLKGVNIGASKPGSFPGEFSISYKDYSRWLKYIGEMNADAIRVYTILKPEFYKALYDYNKTSKKPIYLFQGVWINEDDIRIIKDAYNPKIMEGFKDDIKTITDVIHGNSIIPEKLGHAYGNYKADVSQYVIGWILGIEWDPEFVINTNKNNKDNNVYDGKYLYADNASPFENFLCRIGDFAIEYETEQYGMQKPLSFTNWLTTDILEHPNEPNENEDIAVVNTEHIKTKKSFKPGLFASYHIYPYYPDFLNYQGEYTSFKDKDGSINTYKAYLRDLKKEHSVPVIVAEFGVPAARGVAHESKYSGFNQGNITEKQQGEMDSHMLSDIYDEGYAGGLIFSWQDEWFKRTWNTMDFDIPDRRPFWSNPQTNEQEFGLLAFDPGKEKRICYVDGDISEWSKDKPIYENEEVKLFVKSDEKFIYLMADSRDFNLNQDKIIIPVDVLNNQGNFNYEKYGVKFNRGADFAVVIDGSLNSRIVVDPYYDVFNYLYSKRLGMVQRDSNYELKNTGFFNPIYLCLNRELYLPQDNIRVPLSKYETGKLTMGNGNPDSDSYNSLTDFAEKDGKIEIRIPWQLFNIMDPSTKMAMADLHGDSIKPIKIEGIYTGAAVLKKGLGEQNIKMDLYTWQDWELPTYHERLKPSYYILKEKFKSIGK